jgi:hypothetical protein
MIDLATYQRLKKQVDGLRAERDRAQGALDHLLQQLSAEHGCDDLEAAEGKMRGLEAEVSREEAAFNASLAEFETEWERRLST